MELANQKGIENNLGLAWRFASQFPMLGTRVEWITQETTHASGGSGPYTLFTLTADAPLFVQGVWVTCAQYKDLFAIRPQIKVNTDILAMPQNVSTFAPMGEGLTRLHQVEKLIDRNHIFTIDSQDMTFYTGQTSKSYMAVVRGWYL